MQIRARRRSTEEQLQLIAECRSSGLSIAEWCRREGIRPDTYYTWIERLQVRGILEKAAPFPQRIVRETAIPDIVKVEVNQPKHSNSYLSQHELQAPATMTMNSEDMSICHGRAVMEIAIHGICIKVTNQVNPQLLAEALRAIGGVTEC